jgi:hypothetical protein
VFCAVLVLLLPSQALPGITATLQAVRARCCSGGGGSCRRRRRRGEKSRRRLGSQRIGIEAGDDNGVEKGDDKRNYEEADEDDDELAGIEEALFCDEYRKLLIDFGEGEGEGEGKVGGGARNADVLVRRGQRLVKRLNARSGGWRLEEGSGLLYKVRPANERPLKTWELIAESNLHTYSRNKHPKYADAMKALDERVKEVEMVVGAAGAAGRKGSTSDDGNRRLFDDDDEGGADDYDDENDDDDEDDERHRKIQRARVKAKATIFFGHGTGDDTNSKNEDIEDTDGRRQGDEKDGVRSKEGVEAEARLRNNLLRHHKEQEELHRAARAAVNLRKATRKMDGVHL